MDAALDEGYYWPSVCGGYAICGACVVRLHEGAENAEAPSELEAGRLAELCFGRDSASGDVRLACQLVPVGPMTIFKIGVRKRDG
jgi:ferredoxin